MARKDHVCPIMKKTCIGCSVYRGRHMGLWTEEKSGEKAARTSTANSTGKGLGNRSEWVTSFDAFVRNVAGPEGITFD